MFRTFVAEHGAVYTRSEYVELTSNANLDSNSIDTVPERSSKTIDFKAKIFCRPLSMLTKQTFVSIVL